MTAAEDIGSDEKKVEFPPSTSNVKEVVENDVEDLAAAAAAADDDDDGDDEVDNDDAEKATDDGEETKSKKKKKKKKKKATQPATIDDTTDEFGDVTPTTSSVTTTNGSTAKITKSSKQITIRQPSKKPVQRGLLPTAYTDVYVKYGQTDPPTIPVALLFEQQNMSLPFGDIQYDIDRNNGSNSSSTGSANGTSHRVTPKETKSATAEDMTSTEYGMMNDTYQKLRLGGEIHRQVRNFAQSIIKPGVVLSDMCSQLENMNRYLTQEAGIERGIAFPTGCSINHVAAHYTPNTGDMTTLQYDDVMKVDFGVQIDGYIIDSAWTVSFNERYDPLLKAVQEATEIGIRTAGVDQRLCDIGAAIQEVMESYEVELNNQTYPVKAIRNLNGHSIGRYQIHGGKSVPIVKNGCEESLRMEEYELYAIETFGSTGRGYVIEDMECSHYMRRFDAPHIPLRMTSSKKLLTHITKTFGTLAFCRRWLDREDGGSATVNGITGGKQDKYMGALKNLCDVGIVQAYPPLCDIKGSYTAQYEHTFMVQANGKKEIFSRGTDY